MWHCWSAEAMWWASRTPAVSRETWSVTPIGCPQADLLESLIDGIVESAPRCAPSVAWLTGGRARGQLVRRRQRARPTVLVWHPIRPCSEFAVCDSHLPVVRSSCR